MSSENSFFLTNHSKFRALVGWGLARNIMHSHTGGSKNPKSKVQTGPGNNSYEFWVYLLTSFSTDGVEFPHGSKACWISPNFFRHLTPDKTMFFLRLVCSLSF